MARRKTAPAIPTNGDALETDAEVYAAIDATERAVIEWKEERDHAVDPDDYSEEENEESERLFREQLEEDAFDVEAYIDGVQPVVDHGRGGPADGLNRDETGRIVEPEGGEFKPGYNGDGRPKAKRAKGRAEIDFRDQRACLCGCGATGPGKYRPGHDTRHRGRLLQEARAGSGEARAELLSLGVGADQIDNPRAKASGRLTAEQRDERARAKLHARAARLRYQLAELEQQIANAA